MQPATARHSQTHSQTQPVPAATAPPPDASPAAITRLLEGRGCVPSVSHLSGPANTAKPTTRGISAEGSRCLDSGGCESVDNTRGSQHVRLQSPEEASTPNSRQCLRLGRYVQALCRSLRSLSYFNCRSLAGGMVGAPFRDICWSSPDTRWSTILLREYFLKSRLLRLSLPCRRIRLTVILNLRDTSLYSMIAGNWALLTPGGPPFLKRAGTCCLPSLGASFLD